ncbi:hypothetical protein GT030_19760 [Streptomyces sp. SID1328]|uniref:hypothetical protein n=1 Tax=Streptomyces sp. SID1328 TaxID=2690250 RepID=UPI00136DD7AB|nr:hypothetical protein [Streptomyces sp. SID1328]MYV41046.1 hypothetical protein [Streptomyces sp. SID1328]
MRSIDDPAWHHNPRLNTWLEAARTAFDSLAAETGGDWDYSPASLDRLERLLLSRYGTWEDIYHHQDDPVLMAAAWYLGEIAVRRHGAVWAWSPDGPRPGDDWPGSPRLTYPRESLTAPETDALDAGEETGEDPLPTVVPLSHVGSLYAEGERHLATMLEHFTAFEQWRAGVHG